MIEFLKINPKNVAVLYVPDEEDEIVSYRMTCDGCGEKVVCTIPKPLSIFDLMLYIDRGALDIWDTRKHFEFCVMVKREKGMYPDYKQLCPECEGDPKCKFNRVDEGYERMTADDLNFSDIPWEDWVIPSGNIEEHAKEVHERWLSEHPELRGTVFDR